MKTSLRLHYVPFVFEKNNRVPRRRAQLGAKRIHARAGRQGRGSDARVRRGMRRGAVQLGDLAAMLGETELVRSKYKKCIEMSQKMEFPQGVKQAQEGLARLTSTLPGQLRDRVANVSVRGGSDD